MIRSSREGRNLPMEIRRHKWTLLFLFLAAIAVVLMAAVVYLLRYSDRGPTSEEFRVYSALLDRLGADEHEGRSSLALVGRTLELSDPHPESWIPTELRSDRFQPPSDFVSFCGHLCGRDFVRKNLVVWWLRPNTTEFPFSTVKDSNTEQYEVAVTRVGFNFLRTRAVLSFAAGCIMSACGKSGDAFFVKQRGIWRLDHY